MALRLLCPWPFILVGQRQHPGPLVPDREDGGGEKLRASPSPGRRLAQTPSSAQSPPAQIRADIPRMSSSLSLAGPGASVCAAQGTRGMCGA